MQGYVLREIDVLKDRYIPNSRHVKGEAIHGSKCPRDGHHIVHDIVVGLRFRERDRERDGCWIHDTIVVLTGRRVEGQVCGASVGGEAIEDAFAVIEAHVGDIPVFFFSDAAQDAPECFDVCEAGAGYFAICCF